MLLKQVCLELKKSLNVLAKAFEQSGAKYFVVDPVMVCKGEDEVLNPGNTDAMIKYLLPKATVVTPNLFGSWSIIWIR